MSREFHIAGNVHAVAEFSPAASWHFVLHARDAKHPNISSTIGSIDVHYPCLTDASSDVFRATILLDPESIEPGDTRPTSDEIHAALKREFSIPYNASWSLGYYECSEGLEDGFDSGAYY